MKEAKTFSTKLYEVGSGRLELDAAELHVTTGPDRGTSFPLGIQPVRIGSSVDCDLVLHDETVSSHHAHVTLSRNGYVMEDLQSKNGIRLGRWPVERVVLADGMRIHLGQTTIKVKALGDRHAIELVAPGRIGEMVAESLAMRAVAYSIEQYAQSDITVLIEGETGVGKEVAARSIHDLSRRSTGPFCVFDCGAVATTLIASELFGYREGAFTGATSSRPGQFEEADGGTLFLDEIAELPLDVQPGLLGAIERKSSRRVGDTKERKHDVRIVAATNRNLAEEVRRGRFRQDLFYRVSVGRLRVPPLRERQKDLAILAEQFAAEEGIALTDELMRLFMAYSWPGNVRELRNTIARAAALPGEPELALAAGSELSHEGGELTPLVEAREQARDAFEREYLEKVVILSGGNLTRAAQLAKVSRSYLMRLAAKHKMRIRDLQNATKKDSQD